MATYSTIKYTLEFDNGDTQELVISPVRYTDTTAIKATIMQLDSDLQSAQRDSAFDLLGTNAYSNVTGIADAEIITYTVTDIV